jgi:hypothetical protein
MMKHKIVRIVIFVLEAFIALTAIVSGVAILTGELQMPLELLRSTPFSDYTIPGLLLAIVVGGSSLVAAATVFIHREFAVLLSVAAGPNMAGWITVQVAMLGLVLWLQVLYFVLGVLIFGLATYLWIAEYHSHYLQTRHISHT